MSWFGKARILRQPARRGPRHVWLAVLVQARPRAKRCGFASLVRLRSPLIYL